MATIQTIGTTGRDFSTLQAWENAIPTTPTGGYEGHCYNDSEFTAGVLIAGQTTSGANYIRLTAASGQSFADHATKTANAQFYDQSKGVGIAANDFAQSVIEISVDFVTIDRLQVKRNGSSYTTSVIDCTTVLANTKIRECIIAKTQSQNAPVVSLRDSQLINCTVYDSGATAGTGVVCFDASLVLNNTIVRSGSAGGAGLTKTYATSGVVVKNNAVFGWTTAFTAGGTWGSGSGFNCTDAAAAPGSSNQVSKTYANQFQSTTVDYRLKAGSDCIDHGSTDATNAPNDIVGTVRGTTTTGDIGSWEFASTAAALEGTPLGVAAATGAITTAIKLGAAAAAVATAVAEINRALVGAATAQAQAGGSLNGTQMAAAAAIQATLQGTLTGIAAVLQGSGLAQAAATATFSDKVFRTPIRIDDGSPNGIPWVNQTGLKWAWWSSIANALSQAPAASGSDGSTDSNGFFNAAAPGTLSAGPDQGFGLIFNLDSVPDDVEVGYQGTFDVQ